jgi:hypothetical protein
MSSVKVESFPEYTKGGCNGTPKAPVERDEPDAFMRRVVNHDSPVVTLRFK